MGRRSEGILCCHGDTTSGQLDRHAIGPLVLAERHPKQIRTRVAYDSNSGKRLGRHALPHCRFLARLSGMETARRAIHYVAPVGEKEIYLERANQAIGPYLVNELKAG